MIMAGDYYSLNITVYTFVYECHPTDVTDVRILNYHTI